MDKNAVAELNTYLSATEEWEVTFETVATGVTGKRKGITHIKFTAVLKSLSDIYA